MCCTCSQFFNSFDMFFLIKGFRATASNTKDVNIGGKNLTNIGCETKFIDTLKYYQNSLVQVAATLSDEEKLAVKKVSEQFLMSDHYFLDVWKHLGPTQKEKNLNIITDGKGIIAFEKIDFNSFSLTPQYGIFFEKCEFYSDL